MLGQRLVGKRIAYLGLFFFLSGCQNEEAGRLETAFREPRQQLTHREFNPTLGPFRIQVAAYENFDEANAFALELPKSNLSSYVVPDSTSFTKPIYRVRVGPFATEAAAFAHLRALREQGHVQAYLVKIEGVPSSELASTGRSDIELEETDLLVKKQLTSTGGCSSPKWSPNGQEIAFYRKTDDLEGIYTVGTGGGHVSRIIESTRTRKITPEFAWAASGAKLAVKAEETTDNWELAEAVWVVDKRGPAAQRAFKISNGWQRIVDLSWSPDGAYIAAGIQDIELAATSSFAVKIRIEKSPSLVDDDTHGSSDESASIIEPLSYSDDRLLAGGWKHSSHYLYFSVRSNINETNGEAMHEYELWSYDLSVRQSALIGMMQKGDILEHFRFAPTGDRGVLFGPSRIAAVDLTSGREIPFGKGASQSTLVQAMEISRSKQVYFLANDELWSYDFNGAKVQTGIKINSRMLTVSPLGSGLCFTEAGNLFTLRMPDK